MRKSKRESLPHGFFLDLLWEPASYQGCIYRHQIWVQLMEAGSAGLVRAESGKTPANLILPFLSIPDAQPPPYLPPCAHSLWVQPCEFNFHLQPSLFSLRFCPWPAPPSWLWNWQFIVELCPLKRAPCLEGANCALQIAQNDAESQDIQPVFPCC